MMQHFRLFAVATALLVLAAAGPAGAVEVKRVVSTAGIEAWLVEDHTNPVITLRFAFRGAAALDPKGKEGLANLVSSTIDEGAGDLDSKAFQGKLEDLAITLRFSAGLDNFRGRLKTLVDNEDAAFEMLHLALTKPRFDAEPLERIRSQVLSGLRQDEESPHTVASRTLFRQMFGDHPYGRPADGTLETVPIITPADLKRFVAERLGRDNLVIGVVGDITPKALAARLDQVFGALPAKAKDWRIPRATPVFSGGVTVKAKKVPQSAIMFTQPGIRRDDKDFFAAYVVNHILADGSFTSRLYSEVREKRGLAYSVSASLWPLDRAALISGGAGTANARVKETIDTVRAEWRRLVDGGIGADELKDAKTYLTGSFPLRFTSSGRIAGMLVGMQLDDLGMDYFERRNAYVDAVTLADANRVAKQLYDAAKLTFVVVGEPKGLPATQ